MDDVVLVTADSVRYDHHPHMEFLSGFDVCRGITAAHYTRPSLASLLSSSYLAAIRTTPVSPTLPEVLTEAGYTCIGLAPNPQTDPEFGFADGFDAYDNFYETGEGALASRKSGLREYLGTFDLVRDVYRRFFPMGAVLDDIPADADLVDMAVRRFNEATPPRFLWIHLMESHRPYGTGADAVPEDIDRKSGAMGSRWSFASGDLSPEEAEVIRTKYVDALGRVDGEIERLLDAIDSEPVFAFASDHGEEFGEDGYYYHQGYRRRVPDRIVTVPAVIDGIDHGRDRLSLLDVAPTIVSGLGLSVPDAWHGNDLLGGPTESTLTIAPWHDAATVLWQDFEHRLVCRDTDVSFVTDAGRTDLESAEASEEVERRLRALGYSDAG